MKHWWEATFNWCLFNSATNKKKQLFNELNAEGVNKKGESCKECQTVHEDGLEVFYSSALLATVPAAAAEWATKMGTKSVAIWNK